MRKRPSTARSILLELLIPDDFDVQPIVPDSVYEAKEIAMEIEDRRELLKEEDSEYEILPDDVIDFIDSIDPDVLLKGE